MDVTLRNKEIVVTPIQRLIVSGDAIDKIRFTVNRYWGGHDLATALFVMKFKLPSGTISGADLSIEDYDSDATSLVVVWNPRGLATSESGRLNIQLQATLVEGVGEDAETYFWQSQISPINVERTIEMEDVIDEEQTYLDSFLESITTLSALAVSAKDDAQTFALSAQGHATDAGNSATSAGIAAAASIDAKDAAQAHAADAYQNLLETNNAAAIAQNYANQAEATFGSLATVQAMAASAEEDAGIAGAAKDAAVLAKGAAEEAETGAIAAKDAAEALYGDLTAVENAKTAAQAAQAGAESARDALVLDAGYQGVVADLETIRAVAANKGNIDGVHANKTNIDIVAGAAGDIGTVAGGINNINEVANNKVNIDKVAGGLVQIAELGDEVEAIQGIYTNLDTLLQIPGKADEVQLALIEVNEVLGDLDDYIDAKERAEAAADAVEAIGYGPIKSIRRKVSSSITLDDPDKIFYGVEDMQIEDGVMVQVGLDSTLVIL